ncbi:25975_t:CDS:2 [Racocetra persica]|uniref:25975_t:CDS:1 n=1 Tax=Racocetra persica TaxID=160502 RepID=A0ACA9KHR4_9GLOM|nr:25975_t:CDS:2 [Racocetra persica]
MIWDVMGPFTILPIPKTPPGKNVTDPNNDVHGEDIFASWNKDIDDTKQSNDSKQNNNKEKTVAVVSKYF